MKLLTFVAGSGVRLGGLDGERVVDLNLAYAAMAAARNATRPYAAADAAVPARMESLLLAGAGGLDAAREALAFAAQEDAPRGPRGEQIVHRRDAVRLRAPLARPEKIIGIGLNYHDHCRETGHEPPKAIRSFGMFANALIGPGEPIVLPSSSTMMDWESELVAVIGTRAKYVPREQALDIVAGYTIGNDISARDHQQADPQTMRGKSGDTHAPIGPWIVTRDEIADPGRLAIGLTVNGVVKQDSTTAEMVFTVAEIITFLSRFFTLAPGDLIFTGTPAGVGFTRKPAEFLHAGDHVAATIAGIGTLENPCVAEGNAAGGP